MRLTKVHLRFFRSFNYDFVGKARRKGPGATWEMIDGVWFPFIDVDLDEDVTAVVGANESGKSHLIAAIWFALTGADSEKKPISRRDFCRYSTSYSVEQGKVRKPDVGVSLEATSTPDRKLLKELGLKPGPKGAFSIYRFGDDTNQFIGKGDPVTLSQEAMERLDAQIPQPFELDTRIALPSSLSFDARLEREVGRLTERRHRSKVIDWLQQLGAVDAESLQAQSTGMAEVLGDGGGPPHSEQRLRETKLARQLLFEVAKIDPTTLEDLERALGEEEEGEVEGILEEVNRALARHLNFRRWWHQDRDFELRLSPRERELVFTIRDRTGRSYSFEERSRGLKFFLSYYIQLRAHQEEQTGGRAEILLMDEPDAYLSNMGQLDLLRTLESFAHPDGGSKEERQVVYVTHSPFLINKNAAQRIRVLAKGSEEDGTLVVSDVSRNHYEPLRSALGSFVAETTFIGGSNLMVEGIADQVLLAGATRILIARGSAPSRVIDLNEVTIVPAGSAAAVPYMAFLARGRDEIKPSVVALLDGDQAGKEAYAMFKRNPKGSKGRFLSLEYVVDLDTWAKNQTELRLDPGVVAREPEDLIPIGILAEAARRYAVRFPQAMKGEPDGFEAAAIAARIAGVDGNSWDALESAFADHFGGASISKLGLARESIHVIEAGDTDPAETECLLGNFSLLIGDLAELLRSAQQAEERRRVGKRSEEIVESFIADNPDGATRDTTDQALRDVEKSLEETEGDEAVRLELQRIRKNFELEDDPLAAAEPFDELRARLSELRVLAQKTYEDAELESAPTPRSDTTPRGAAVRKGSDTDDVGNEAASTPSS
jgi:hypothetical protein